MCGMAQHGDRSQRGAPYYVVLAGVSVLLGMLSTVGVAWAIARPVHLNSGARTFGQGFLEEFILRTESGDFAGVHSLETGAMQCYQFTLNSGTGAYLAANAGRIDDIRSSDLPHWVYVPGPDLQLPADVPRGVAPSNHLSYAFGWPWLARRGWVVDNGRPSVLAGRDLWTLGPAGGWVRGLPLSPVWPGFAADSLLFAAVWFVMLRLFAAPARRGMAWLLCRKGVRRGRGCCPECGYDLRGDLEAGCPECGWRRET